MYIINYFSFPKNGNLLRNKFSDRKNCFYNLLKRPKTYFKKFESQILKPKITTISQMGYPQQIELFTMLSEMGDPPIILDAGDVLKNPNQMLKLLCEKIDIPFYDKMLNWPIGKRESDGIWEKVWYQNVKLSTNFQKYKKKRIDIPIKYQNVYEECLEIFEELNTYNILNGQ